MNNVKRILKSVEDGVITSREGSRLIVDYVLAKMESSQIADVLRLCDEGTSSQIKQLLANIPELECEWRRRFNLTSNGIFATPTEVQLKMVELKKFCLSSGIELPPTDYPELPELTLTPSGILEIDDRPWKRNCIYDYVEKYVIGGPLAMPPQISSHGVFPKRQYSTDETVGNPYLGRLWERLLNFHPWERTQATGSRSSAIVMLVSTDQNIVFPSRLVVIRGNDSLSVLDLLIEKSNASMHDDYDMYVCDGFKSGASFALRGTPAAIVSQALLLAKLSRQRLLAELKSK